MDCSNQAPTWIDIYSDKVARLPRRESSTFLILILSFLTLSRSPDSSALVPRRDSKRNHHAGTREVWFFFTLPLYEMFAIPTHACLRGFLCGFFFPLRTRVPEETNTLLVVSLQHAYTMKCHPCLRDVDTAPRSCFLTGIFSRLKRNQRYLAVHFFFNLRKIFFHFRFRKCNAVRWTFQLAILFFF